MPESVHSRAWDFEFVEHRPKPKLDNFVSRVRSAVAIEKKKPLGIFFPRRQVFPEQGCERVRHRYWRLARLALYGLHPAVPRRPSHVDHAALKVEVLFLQAHNFSDAKPRHCGNGEHGAPRFASDGDDFARLLSGEKARLIVDLIRRQGKLVPS